MSDKTHSNTKSDGKVAVTASVVNESGVERSDMDVQISANCLDKFYGESSGARIGFNQICMIALSILADCHVSCCLFYFVFESSTQGWQCSDIMPSERNASHLTSDDVTSVNNVTAYNETCSCSRRMFNPEHTSPATEFNLVCERRSLAKLMTTAYFTGSIFGSILGGYLGDRYGRKRTALILWTLMTSCMAMTSLAPTWYLYAVFRFFVGVGGGPVSGCLMVLCCEYVNSRWRTIVSSQMGFSLGALLCTLMTYLMPYNWRYLTITLALMFSPLILIACWIMPESARLLLLRGRVVEAHAELTKLANHNNISPPDLQLLEMISENEQSSQKRQKYYSVLDLFRGCRMATMTTIVLIC